MTTFYAYTLTDDYMRAAAVAGKVPWANGPAVSRQMAIHYYRYLKAYGPLRMKSGMINGSPGYIIALGKNNTDLESIPGSIVKQTRRMFGSPPHLFTKIPDQRYAYSTVVSPEQDWVEGKGYDLDVTLLAVHWHNIPLAPEDQKI